MAKKWESATFNEETRVVSFYTVAQPSGDAEPAFTFTLPEVDFTEVNNKINAVETKIGTVSEGKTVVGMIEENSILVASTFAGNHWDTDRQKLQGKKSFSVSTSWIYLHVYDELERFLKGTVTLPEMIAKLQRGFQNEIDGRIYAAFNGIGTYLPSAFQEKGTYDRGLMNDLIQRVQVASQKEVILAGTRTALAHIAEGMDTAWIANSQKEELATTGTPSNK